MKYFRLKYLNELEFSATNTDNGYERSQPDLIDRNTDQYWIVWFREAASKGLNKIEKLNGPIDRAFNLTTSYRRDSDIPRVFGTANKAILRVRDSIGSILFFENLKLLTVTGLSKV